nr:sialidase family protein [Rhodopirellula sp. SM50]
MSNRVVPAVSLLGLSFTFSLCAVSLSAVPLAAEEPMLDKTDLFSDDDGVTFSEPTDITAAFEPFRKDYDWHVLATGPGHGIQLRNGRLLVPVWLSTATKPPRALRPAWHGQGTLTDRNAIRSM